ncbi:hemolysin XhlA family protein [Clostridium felsineum]|uniref:Uncharacterized protein n=1 Tax=Clostridium felsineum TaxID=36839 RepID=A0A1S8M2G5_9CLOT|nr:hemolysin XhlA family protein [Clostridium felsineum]URZ06762.1 hypothetical protein CLROS_020950 [Clostridium felsineum]URZ11794.1 hypothetical protein CROST_025110 [Clostridium felsineum]
MDDKDNKIQEILERLVRMETKLDDFTSLREKAEDAFNISNQNNKDLNEIQDNIRWLWRSILGAVVVSVVGFIIKFHT